MRHICLETADAGVARGGNHRSRWRPCGSGIGRHRDHVAGDGRPAVVGRSRPRQVCRGSVGKPREVARGARCREASDRCREHRRRSALTHRVHGNDTESVLAPSGETGQGLSQRARDEGAPRPRLAAIIGPLHEVTTDGSGSRVRRTRPESSCRFIPDRHEQRARRARHDGRQRRGDHRGGRARAVVVARTHPHGVGNTSGETGQRCPAVPAVDRHLALPGCTGIGRPIDHVLVDGCPTSRRRRAPRHEKALHTRARRRTAGRTGRRVGPRHRRDRARGDSCTGRVHRGDAEGVGGATAQRRHHCRGGRRHAVGERGPGGTEVVGLLDHVVGDRGPTVRARGAPRQRDPLETCCGARRAGCRRTTRNKRCRGHDRRRLAGSDRIHGLHAEPMNDGVRQPRHGCCRCGGETVGEHVPRDAPIGRPLHHIVGDRRATVCVRCRPREGHLGVARGRPQRRRRVRRRRRGGFEIRRIDQTIR